MVTNGHSRTRQTAPDLGSGRLTRCVKRPPKQRVADDPASLTGGPGYFRRPHADTIRGRLTLDVGVVRKTMASSRAGRSTSPAAII